MLAGLCTEQCFQDLSSVQVPEYNVIRGNTHAIRSDEIIAKRMTCYNSPKTSFVLLFVSGMFGGYAQEMFGEVWGYVWELVSD